MKHSAEIQRDWLKQIGLMNITVTMFYKMKIIKSPCLLTFEKLYNENDDFTHNFEIQSN